MSQPSIYPGRRAIAKVQIGIAGFLMNIIEIPNKNVLENGLIITLSIELEFIMLSSVGDLVEIGNTCRMKKEYGHKTIYHCRSDQL